MPAHPPPRRGARDGHTQAPRSSIPAPTWPGLEPTRGWGCPPRVHGQVASVGVSGRAWGVRQCVPGSHGPVSVPTHLRPGLQSWGWPRSSDPAPTPCAGPGGALWVTASEQPAPTQPQVWGWGAGGVAMIPPYPQLWGEHRSPCPCTHPTTEASGAPPLPRLQDACAPSPAPLCPQMLLLLPTSPPRLLPVLRLMSPQRPQSRPLSSVQAAGPQPRLPPSSRARGRPAGPALGWGSQETRGLAAGDAAETAGGHG